MSSKSARTPSPKQPGALTPLALSPEHSGLSPVKEAADSPSTKSAVPVSRQDSDSPKAKLHIPSRGNGRVFRLAGQAYVIYDWCESCEREGHATASCYKLHSELVGEHSKAAKEAHIQAQSPTGSENSPSRETMETVAVAHEKQRYCQIAAKPQQVFSNQAPAAPRAAPGFARGTPLTRPRRGEYHNQPGVQHRTVRAFPPGREPPFRGGFGRGAPYQGSGGSAFNAQASNRRRGGVRGQGANRGQGQGQPYGPMHMQSVPNLREAKIYSPWDHSDVEEGPSGLRQGIARAGLARPADADNHTGKDKAVQNKNDDDDLVRKLAAWW